MKQKADFPKVIMDMFLIQMSWALGFLGIMLAINIFEIIRTITLGGGADHYFNAVFVAATIFMLVIGITSVYFLPHYIENGVTRKDYFKGTLIASIALSLIIPVIAFCVSAIEQVIVTNITRVNFNDPDINSVILEIDSEFIGDIVQSVILTPYVDPSSNWILAMAIFSLNIFLYYLLGWLISAGFYRFDTITGLGFILIALVFLMLTDTLLRVSLNLPVLDSLAVLNSLQVGMAVVGIVSIVLVSIWIIRLLTKKITVKI